MCELTSTLAVHQGKGYVIAPAGFGKTHLIAEAVAKSAGRQLVLTHTFAGVRALRLKMQSLGVASSCFYVDTIASWVLRLCLAYPKTSDWIVGRPATSEDWRQLYCSGAKLLSFDFIHRIIKASYTGFYVDEYQDCTITQHELVLALAETLPCRLLGDPLQGIFDFNDEPPVEWNKHVSTVFERLGALGQPWRWTNAEADDLGAWLTSARSVLERGEAIDLANVRSKGVSVKRVEDEDSLRHKQYSTCKYLSCADGETAIAIHQGSQQFKAQCHRLANRLSGTFASIEEVEGAALFSFFRKVEAARTNANRLKEVNKFAAKCLNAAMANLPVATKRGDHAQIQKNTRNPEIAKAANAYLADSSAIHMSAFFEALTKVDGVAIFRRDLFNRARAVLAKAADMPGALLSQAAEAYHREFRHRGRPVRFPKLIGTTLLVKGLEFDHAIVLDAASLNRKELYVALTRGAKSLTIISTERFVPTQAWQRPADARQDDAA